jgi:hypothetical protein
MKKIITALLFATFCQGSYAQEPVLTIGGDIYFIPGSMTKGGEAFLVSLNTSNHSGFTIYDGDFNVVREFADPAAGQPYQQRVVTLTRVVDPGTGSGNVTRAAGEDWTVVDDKTYDYTTSSTLSGFELYSDNNSYHSRYIYVTQTLFDDDEEFEYVRKKQAIVPISMKYSDYANEHSTGNEPAYHASYGDATLDSIMEANGASDYQYFWDNESGKQLLRLYKHDYYGGIFSEGLEIATLDGTVKAFLPNISSISSAYYFRGKCYVKGYDNNSNSVLYLLGNGATGIRELSRSKVDFLVRRVGCNLVFESETDGQQTVVMSRMDGSVVRSMTARKGSNIIPLNGLQGGVYNVTLYRQSSPVKSSKIIVK